MALRQVPALRLAALGDVARHPVRNGGGEPAADLHELSAPRELLSEVLQRLDVDLIGVVQILLSALYLGLEPIVVLLAAGVEHLVELDIDRVTHAVEDDVDEVGRPTDKAPVLRVVVADLLALVAGSERDRHDLGVRMAIASLYPGAERRVVRVHTTVDERVRCSVGGLGAEWREIRRRGRGRSGDLPTIEVVRLRRLRLPAPKEERAAALDLIRRHEKVRSGIAQMSSREVLLQYFIDAVLRILGALQVVQREDPVQEAAAEDAAPLVQIQTQQIRG